MTAPLIAVVDYGIGNIGSVDKALCYIGANSKITSKPEDIEKANGLVLPGVSSFGACMESLEKNSLKEAILKHISAKKPFLGICVGYQVLFEESEESPGIKGLSIFKGKIVRFQEGLKIPHMGWNTVHYRESSLFFKGVPQDAYFYFVHSYYPIPEEDIAAGKTFYGNEFVSAVEKDNIWAVQFHLEKSAENGLKLLRNFERWCRS